jgi:predicted glycosyltransferase
MADVWLDCATPKHAILGSILYSYLTKQDIDVLVTARQQTQTCDLLRIFHTPFVEIGEYGSTLAEKLQKEAERILALLRLFEEEGTPKVLWTHGEISAIRTAFGLEIPIVLTNDTVHAEHVGRLSGPLVNCLVAPACFGFSWVGFGVPRRKTFFYDGIEEVALIREMKYPEQKSTRSRKRILFRNVEYSASYYRGIARERAMKIDVDKILRELKEIADVVVMPRYESEMPSLEKLRDEHLEIVNGTRLTVDVLKDIDYVVGSGGSICRESALLGIPTISFCFWDVIAQYLSCKGFPILLVEDSEEIVENVEKWLANGGKKVDVKAKFEKLESPIPLSLSKIKDEGKIVNVEN